ncbi:MAG: hypothetical protein ACOYXC_03170 [Candidatus Rifleibacteriota bacterium]
MGPVFGSILKMVIALVTLGAAAILGWRLEPAKDPAERAPLMLGVGISTFSPIGLFLYIKFWEEKPEFSAACGKQAILGLICYLSFLLISYVFPNAPTHW